MKQNYNIKQIVYFAIGILGIGFLAALQMKLNIGIGPWDGMGRSISYVTNLRVGDISTILSVSCVFLNLLLLRKDFNLTHVLTLVVGILLGQIINFFFYTFFENLVIESYPLKLIIFVVSVVIMAIAVSIVQTSKFISLPLESFCQEFADRNGKTFAFMRQAADVFSVVTIVVITLFFKVPLTLREGTIISMIIFGPITGVVMPRLTRWLNQTGIVKVSNQVTLQVEA
ncbi:MAG: hypothetical protein GXY98_01260 [Erysipelothrix sp.]|nr:hypothetical protein [Erysipelothrix sp.]